jgi:hypothetical protein
LKDTFQVEEFDKATSDRPLPSKSAIDMFATEDVNADLSADQGELPLYRANQ